MLVVFLWGEWLLFNANSAIYQLYRGDRSNANVSVRYLQQWRAKLHLKIDNEFDYKHIEDI
jgi:hypothetical protein